MQDLERQFKSQENGLRIGELIFVDSQKIYAQLAAWGGDVQLPG
jgi:hypothetical protein